MNFWELFNELASEIHGAIISSEDCWCHGHVEQIDGFLAPDVPVRIVAFEGTQTYHVSIGDIPKTPPPPVSERELIEMLENYS